MLQQGIHYGKYQKLLKDKETYEQIEKDNAFLVETKKLIDEELIRQMEYNDKMVRDLNRTSEALGDGNKVVYELEKPPVRKMGKMIVAARDLPIGQVLTESDLDYRSPADGLPPSMSQLLIGKSLSRAIEIYTPITLTDLI
jgi:sialic acid synthase SpsE